MYELLTPEQLDKDVADSLRLARKSAGLAKISPSLIGT